MMTVWKALEDLKQIGPLNYSTGICGNIYRHMSVEASRVWRDHKWNCFSDWDEYSGFLAFPVPVPDNRCSPGYAFETTPVDDMWNPEHPYGNARLRLLDHCINWFKEFENKAVTA